MLKMSVRIEASNEWLFINESVDDKNNLLNYINNIDAKYELTKIVLIVHSNDRWFTVLLKGSYAD